MLYTFWLLGSFTRIASKYVVKYDQVPQRYRIYIGL